MSTALQDLLAGLRARPIRRARCVWMALLFAALAYGIGHYGGLFTIAVLDSPLAPVLPLTMLVFPSLIEEAFFRGILLPRSLITASRPRQLGAIGVSALLFTLWHPVNAFLVNAGAARFFYNPWFLAIVFLLGVTCGATYLISRSLWVPVVLHWSTVLTWVFFLGGRNLVKEAAG